MKGVILDLIVLLSIVSITYGCWLIYPPAAFITAGVICFTLSLGILGKTNG